MSNVNSTGKRIATQFFSDKEWKLVLCNDGRVYSFDEEAVTTTDAGGARINTMTTVFKRRTEYENLPQD